MSLQRSPGRRAVEHSTEGERDCVGRPCRSFPFSIFLPYPGWITGGWLCSESNSRSQSAYPLSSFVIRTLHCYRRALGRAVVTLPSPWCIVVEAKHLDRSGDEAYGHLVGARARKHTGKSSGDVTALNRLGLTSAQGIEVRSRQWIQAQTWAGRGTRA
ncbi:hypothetical protein DFH08DRAFT_858593 [Mycena albidolilacea]|uniref:Uncharacterized protein n=1 Tax=Mycena albidolilacea TaxID=1033008 RepID=A0AAD7A9I7_9AGAR|nr:hypothetical protein DFH08DRAFT_858593 [Mycena albidolilacea]